MIATVPPTRPRGKTPSAHNDWWPYAGTGPFGQVSNNHRMACIASQTVTQPSPSRTRGRLTTEKHDGSLTWAVGKIIGRRAGKAERAVNLFLTTPAWSLASPRAGRLSLDGTWSSGDGSVVQKSSWRGGHVCFGNGTRGTFLWQPAASWSCSRRTCHVLRRDSLPCRDCFPSCP